MAWDEWEQLKANAADRHPTQLQLNQAPTDRGSADPSPSGADGWDSGGSTGLKSSRAAWSKAGEGVGSLRENISKALAKLEDGQKGLGQGPQCLSAAAQQSVHDSWERYVKDVSRRCGSLQKLLEQMGRHQQKTDEAVEAGISKLSVAYGDTPATGGQAKGQ
ncbi:hypothetical protein [Streptomyces sp. NPDC003032]